MSSPPTDDGTVTEEFEAELDERTRAVLEDGAYDAVDADRIALEPGNET